MRVSILSDIHTELHRDLGFFERLPDADLALVAGDVGNSRTFVSGIRNLCRRYDRVVFVLGNHECWDSSLEDTVKVARSIDLPGFTFLNHSMVEIEGLRILGTPLWFPKTPMAERQCPTWSDFLKIRGFWNSVYRENRNAQRFLHENLREGDIVLTHYLPLKASIAPRFVGGNENCYFLCDVEPLIEERLPRLWVHGHTHDCMDYHFGPTRVIANPYGYEGFGNSTKTWKPLVLDL